MYRWIRPRVAVPVHGEARHMDSNARIAADCGVPVQLRGQNGDLFDLVLDKVKPSAAPVGRLWFDERKRVLEKV
jgi:ribonuclease J